MIWALIITSYLVIVIGYTFEMVVNPIDENKVYGFWSFLGLMIYNSITIPISVLLSVGAYLCRLVSKF